MHTLSPNADTALSEPVPSQPGTPAFSPLYQQIKGLILQRLQAGDWKPAEAIPSEIELAARFRVSQGTVRKAIDELAAENLVVRRQGKGTFVATHSERQVRYRFLKLVPDRSSDGSPEPVQADRRVLDCKRIRSSSEIARTLGLKAGEPVLQARRILSFAGVPTISEELWLPGQPFKGLTAARMEEHRGPTYALFELEFGVRMVRASEKLRAIAASAEQADLLQVPQGSPLLSVERLAFTYKDTPMELRRGLYRTEGYHYRNELS